MQRFAEYVDMVEKKGLERLEVREEEKALNMKRSDGTIGHRKVKNL